MAVWRYEPAEIREDVEGQLPDNVKLHVYKVTSGDSGKKYYVQRLEIWTRNHDEPQVIYLCNCENALGALPLAILGVRDPCKHAENLKAYLQERKKK